jgi:hypothetical protein
VSGHPTLPHGAAEEYADASRTTFLYSSRRRDRSRPDHLLTRLVFTLVGSG